MLAFVTFFDGVPDVQPDPVPDLQRKRPPWEAPPRGWVGGPLPWHVEIFSGANLYVAMGNVSAFPSGVLFDVDVRIRPGITDGDDGPGRTHRLVHYSLQSRSPRLGWAFSDGRKAIAGRPILQGPNSASLIGNGGGGSGSDWLDHMWLWPSSFG